MVVVVLAVMVAAVLAVMVLAVVLALLVALQVMETLRTSMLDRQPLRPQRRQSMPSPTPSPLVVNFDSPICQRPRRWHRCP